MSARPAASDPLAGLPADARPREGLAVGICTYRRRLLLERTLDRVLPACSAWGAPVQLIVIDNDGQDPAVRAAVEARAGRPGVSLHFAVEHDSGIAAARNAVFARADALAVRYLAMIDDDEWPESDWLVELMAEQRRTGAAVVGAPVRPHFPVSAAHLTRWSRYWSVERQLVGGKPFVYACGNFLVDLQAIEDEPRPLFDRAFGLSGGEDVVFFRRLFFSGRPMAWAEAAAVHEEVPPNRASVAWLRQRRFGVGVNAVRWERLDASAARTLAKTLGLTLRLLVYPLTGREPRTPWMGWLLEAEKVRGRFAAHLGHHIQPYASAGAQADAR